MLLNAVLEYSIRNILRYPQNSALINMSLNTVAYRGGGGWGVQTLPKFRRYRWSPRSREQEEPASRFPFAVRCVLIRL